MKAIYIQIIYLPNQTALSKKLDITHENSYDDCNELALPLLPISPNNVSGMVNNNINFIFLYYFLVFYSHNILIFIILLFLRDNMGIIELKCVVFKFIQI